MENPITREEKILNAISSGEDLGFEPFTREEMYLAHLAGIGEKPEKPITRKEMFLDKIELGSGGGTDDDSQLDALIDGSITEITSNATSIRDYAFYYNHNLIKADFPLVTSVGESAFSGCSKLTTVDFPAVTSIHNYAFNGCSTLTTVDFPLVTSIGSYVLQSCSQLTTVILRNTTMVTLGSVNSFTATPIASGTGYIYVPRALVDSYKSATNWSTYASQFRALEDYTVDGTITGELDESKI